MIFFVGCRATVSKFIFSVSSKDDANAFGLVCVYLFILLCRLVNASSSDAIEGNKKLSFDSHSFSSYLVQRHFDDDG